MKKIEIKYTDTEYCELLYVMYKENYSRKKLIEKLEEYEKRLIE